MSLTLPNPQESIAHTVDFLRTLFREQHKSQAVIAVSGGIDSAVSLTLLTQALGPDKITPLFLPMGTQSTLDSQKIATFNHIPESNWREVNIEPLVAAAKTALKIPASETIRQGNLMARTRMMVVYDTAKELEALVCGTENKSEHYLGYFTRFGDAASDLEPLAQWYKTQVRQLAEHLHLPDIFITKAPSAGLWAGQTDEQEMGFTYLEADQVLYQLVEVYGLTLKPGAMTNWPAPGTIQVPGIKPETVEAVINQVKKMAFKLLVPYQLEHYNYHKANV